MHYAPIRSQLMTPFSEPIVMRAYFTVRKGSFHPEGNIMIRRKMQDPRTDLICSSRDLVCSDRKICRAVPNWVNILSGQSSRRAGIATQEQTDSAPPFQCISWHFFSANRARAKRSKDYIALLSRLSCASYGVLIIMAGEQSS